MSLQSEIDERKRSIRTTSYSMSLGELMSIYEKQEIDIHPDFQRFFRWTAKQKTNLIESILLGIPLPPIFVNQRSDGVWDVIDGLQRLSTIFEFTGVLRDYNDESIPPATLEAAKYLPSLEGKVWENWKEKHKARDVLTPAQRLAIKRAKLDITILMNESDPNAKYDLFQRLNTGGSHLSEQEVRNCILIMMNRDFYLEVADLAHEDNFLETIAITERAQDQQYHMELAVRYMVFRRMHLDDLRHIGDTNEFLTDQVAGMATNKELKLEREKRAFRATFELLSRAMGSDAFRKYNNEKEKFSGGFLVSAFEGVAMGLGYHVLGTARIWTPDVIANKVRELWQNKAFTDASGAGIRGSTRIPKTIAIGRETFSQ